MAGSMRMLAVAGCLIALALPAAAQEDAAAPPEAVTAATEWLALVDARDYAASWQAAARSFQSAVTEAAWSAQLAAGRAQVGPNQTRELARTQAVTNPPGAPPGDYVQIEYNSTFETIGRASENIALVRDGDRGWRVAGYFLRPPG